MKTYAEKLDAFRSLVEKQSGERHNRLYPNSAAEKFGVEQGYKFDKVFCIAGNGQILGRYMVESRTGNIYGIKSWTQVNKRRQYGTLDTIDQYDWSEYYGRALPHTQAEIEHQKREETIKAGHKKRGRKPNATKLSPKTAATKVSK